MISTDTTLYTNKYKLRIPNKEDIDFIYSATQYSNFNKWMQWDKPENKEELEDSLKRNIEGWKEGIVYNFTIELKENPSIRLGRITIRQTKEENIWELGYWTHPQYQRRGIMSEVVNEVVNFGFERLKCEEIRGRYAIENKGSEKVLLSNGFKFLKHIEEGFKKSNKWVSENELNLKEATWRQDKIKKDSCKFCSRLSNNPNTIFEDNEVIILLDIDPISLSHVIICPKQHDTDFHEMPDKLIERLMIMAKKYIQLSQRIFTESGYSMMLNGGDYNDLKHCHLHIIPRRSKEEFQWTYSEENLSKDATRFEILKKYIDDNW